MLPLKGQGSLGRKGLAGPWVPLWQVALDILFISWFALLIEVNGNISVKPHVTSSFSRARYQAANVSYMLL